MVATLQQIIGKINPRLYAANGKELLKKYGSADKIPAEEVEPQAVKYFSSGDVFMIVGLDRAYMVLSDTDVSRINGVPAEEIPVIQLDNGAIVHVNPGNEYSKQFVKLPTDKITHGSLQLPAR